MPHSISRRQFYIQDIVEELDAGIGRVLDHLKNSGLEENTIVVFTSDNGAWFEGSKGGLRGAKGQSYEGGVRVPFLVRWPGKTIPGQKEDCVAGNLDLFPTLLNIAGLHLPKDRIIDGQDLTSAFQGNGQKHTDRKNGHDPQAFGSIGGMALSLQPRTGSHGKF